MTRIRFRLKFSLGLLGFLAALSAFVLNSRAAATVVVENSDLKMMLSVDPGITVTSIRAPDVRYFSNGHDLNELNQVFAAGHGLALCCNSGIDSGHFIHANAPYIQQLVQWRKQFADALIHGRQRYQPKTGNTAVAAYSYLGTQSRILMIVNTSVGTYKGSIELDPDDARFSWRNLSTDSPIPLRSDGAGRLSLEIPPEQFIHSLKSSQGLVVLEPF